MLKTHDFQVWRAVQPGCWLLHAAGVAEYHPRGLRMVTVPVQGISGRGAAVVSCHAYCFINPEVLACSTKKYTAEYQVTKKTIQKLHVQFRIRNKNRLHPSPSWKCISSNKT
jgi:hypothetical protein